MGEILIGTSGWEYAEWVGPFYPPHAAKDKLVHYASRFPLVEVNSTFYRLPPASVAASWVRRTPARFRFAAKFPRSITHEARLVGAEEELQRFLQVLRPIREAGKFAAALLQLPPSLPFDEPTARSFYERLPRDLRVAVEFREPSWLAPASFELLHEFALAYVVVDEPWLPIRLEVTAPFSYVRWHGRGERLWYDYAYSREELKAWVPRVRELAGSSESLFGFFNNHFRGDAPANGAELHELLGIPPMPGQRRLGDRGA